MPGSRKNWLVAVLFALFAAHAAHAQVVINEVFENPPGDDDPWEYIELYGKPGMDLTGYAIGLLKGGRDFNGNGVIDAIDGDVVPEIDEAFSLDGRSLGANGFLVIYNNTSGSPGAGISNLIDLNLIHPDSARAPFAFITSPPDPGTHIPTTDTAGGLDDDGSSTYVLVRKRPHHSINAGASVYGPGYAFRKDIRHDVNFDGDVDFGTEVNVIGTGELAMAVEHYQMVDDFSWSNDSGKEYHRDGEHEISDTPGFNCDAVCRYRYYLTNPQRGYRTVGNALNPFSIEPTVIADESFFYGEIASVFPGSTFLELSAGTDLATGHQLAKAPTNMAATRYDGTCDPEPDDFANPGCAPNANGAYEFTDTPVVDFKLTPGTFNDHPTDTAIRQFRFVRADFNSDGLINQIDRRLIQDRVSQTLDDLDPAFTTYDPTPGNPASGDEVSYQRFLRQGADFQLVLMMRDMDLDDGPGGTNAAAITNDDLNAFLAECPVCGTVGTPPAVRITEYMYSGNGGEFIEFTNLSGAPVDMTGWSYSDSAQLAGQVDLSAFGTVQPGESVILTEQDRAQFAVEWDIVGTKVIGMLSTNLGRSDEINLYNNSGNLADRLTYSDQNFPGTIRAQNFSGWPCDTAVGANTIAGWRLSLIGGDAQSSFFSTNGDVGNPGTFVIDNCATTLPTGACCTAGVCSQGPGITQGYCQQTGGIYQGDGASCGSISCPQPSNAVVRITEYMYSGPGGEFIEITNRDVAPVDLTGWSYDDSGRLQGAFDIGAFGTLAVGESAIITDADATAFRTHWGLPGTTKVVGNLGLGGIGNNLGRNDEINIYDASGTLVDRLTYGDENFPGTIRTQNASGWPCSVAIGANDIANWTLSTVGDVQNSIDAGGAIGSPGSFILDPCAGQDPIGACCRVNGTCEDNLTQASCEATNGEWQGADTLCTGVDCPSPSDQLMRITEWTYSAISGEFIEFTNIGPAPIDMTGWSFDDDSNLPGTTPLGEFGVVNAGESVVLCEPVAGTFATAWNLVGADLVPPGVDIIGGNSNNLGRNDQINLYDANGLLVDRLSYGDQTFPGSIRTQNITGWTCHENLGTNEVIDWQLSVAGDGQNSVVSAGGDIGNPLTYTNVPCPPECNTCLGDSDESGDIGTADIADFVSCALSTTPYGQCLCSDMNTDGFMDGRDISLFTNTLITNPGACP